MQDQKGALNVDAKEQAVAASASQEVDRSKSYWSQYYMRNRERILSRRRQLYASDPSYRARVLEWCREYKTRRKLGDSAELPRRVKGVFVYLPPGSEQPMKLYSVSYLAERCNRTKQALVHLEKVGMVPRAPYFFRGRLYTEEDVSVISSCLSKHEHITNTAKVKAAILRGYAKLGIDISSRPAMQRVDVRPYKEPLGAPKRKRRKS